jgi:hypothetical protein
VNTSSASGVGQILLNAVTYYVGHAYVVNASNQAVAITGSQAGLPAGIFLGVNFEGQASVLGDGSTTYTTLYVGKVWLKNATSATTVTAIGSKCYFENGEYVGNTLGTLATAGRVLALNGGAGGDILVDMTDRN